MNSVNKLRLVIFSVVFFFVLSARGQTTNYQVHSLFVVNIAKYSTWPTHTGDFKITVFGKSKIFDELTKQSAGKNINGMPLIISQTDNLTEVGTPQIIFVADGKSSALDDILKATVGKSIMVIAEREGLFKKGAGFSFVILDNNTLRYDINNSELEKRQIKVSKNLASLANTTM
jgi:hypothetical protein